jgi:hypothetical protein
MIEIWENTKNWWVKKNKEYALDSVPSILLGDLPTKDWQEKIEKLEKLSEINDLGWKVKKEIDNAKSSLAFGAGAWGLKKFDERELRTEWLKDITELEREWTLLKAESETAKPMIEKYENAFNDFHSKIKNLLGITSSDSIEINRAMLNWETKLVKKSSGDKDKDIQDLQKQVGDLNNSLTSTQNEKSKVEKELKEKKDEWLNHNCNTPNAKELNDLKDELKKVNQEKDRLQTELNNKDPNIPIPVPQQKEEDKKEEEEIKNLSDEELREKLKSKLEEIRNLKAKLEQKEENKGKNKVVKEGFGFGTLLAVGTIAGFVVTVLIWVLFSAKKKKKKAKTKQTNW